MSREDTAVEYTVCYADTDAGGYVYHARFIEMAERARNQLMYKAGFSFALLAKNYDVMLIVHKVEALHHMPAFLEDRLTLRAHIARARASRSTWVTDVTRGPDLLARITMDMVALSVSARQLARHPEAFLQALELYTGAPGHQGQSG